CDFEIPESKEYAVGMLFLPKSTNQSKLCIDIFNQNVKRQGLQIIGWRDVPVDQSCIGTIAAESEPVIKQVFIGKNNQDLSEQEFNAKLFSARKIAEHAILNSNLAEAEYFYFASLSTNTIIYKGLLMPQDISRYYIDLVQPEVVT